MKFSPKQQTVMVSIFILVLVFISIMSFKYLGLFETLELKSLDFRFLQRGPIEHTGDVVVVSLDQESWESIPFDYPYPRTMWAKLFQNLNDAGAKLIVSDIQFDVAWEDTVSDQIFADVIREAGNVILCSKLNLVTTRGQVFTSITEPYKPFYDACLTTGLIGELKDIDQFTRHYSIFYPIKDNLHLFLGMKVVKEFLGIDDSVQMQLSNNMKYIEYGPLRILHDREDINSITINYYGPSKTFKTFSLADALDDFEIDLLGDADTDYMELWKENSIYPPEVLALLNADGNESPFKDKIVLIGDALEEHFDLKYTPFFLYNGEKNLTSGVEHHAHAIQTILDGSYIAQPPVWLENLILIILSIITLLLANWLGPIWGLISLLFIGGAYLYSTIFLFSEHRIWMEWLPPIAAILGSYGLNTLYDFILEQREKKKIRGMFSTYMSPKILKYLEDHPDAFRLTGEKRESSIFFSDVEGFTTISESLSAEELATVLNKYLSPMTDILMSYNGYVDKYEGDAIMCDFGVPVEDPDHAKSACWAAIEQQQELVTLRKTIREEHGVDIYVRMGINSGLVSAGNMGSAQRFQYTVMGDAVNAASRFEGANKAYGTYLMIGQNTYDLAKDYIEARVLDKLVVKGKAKPITVYNLMGKKGEISENEMKLIEHFEKAMDLYWNKKWDEAVAEFEKGMTFVPDDNASKTFISRCNAFKETAPPEKWAGEFIMQTK